MFFTNYRKRRASHGPVRSVSVAFRQDRATIHRRSYELHFLPYNDWAADQIFMKSGMEIMPLQARISKFSTIGNTNVMDAEIREVDAWSFAITLVPMILCKDWFRRHYVFDPDDVIADVVVIFRTHIITREWLDWLLWNLVWSIRHWRQLKSRTL